MRGSPLVRAALAFLVILLLGWPLRELTGGSPQTGAARPTATPAPAKEIELQLSFTAIPKTVRVLHLGKEIWRDAAPAAEIERKLRVPFPKEGVDLQFEVEFPDGSPLVAMRARLTDSAGETHERSLWGTGRIDEVLTFP
jgi:hypothetical protein